MTTLKWHCVFGEIKRIRYITYDTIFLCKWADRIKALTRETISTDRRWLIGLTSAMVITIMPLRAGRNCTWCWMLIGPRILDHVKGTSCSCNSHNYYTPLFGEICLRARTVSFIHYTVLFILVKFRSRTER